MPSEPTEPTSSGTVTVSPTGAGSPSPATSVTSTSRSIERTPRTPALLRSEALPAVEADAQAVQHRVLDDRHGELAVLLGVPHPLGKRGVLGEDGGELVGDALGQPRAEETGRDGDGPDAQAAQVTRHRQHHAGD